MSDGKASRTQVGSTIESLEERQWRLKVEEAKAALKREEEEWGALLARSKHALENEEREWARVMARAQARSSGAFPARPEAAASVPPPLPGRSGAFAAQPEGKTPPPLPRASGNSGKR